MTEASVHAYNMPINITFQNEISKTKMLVDKTFEKKSIRKRNFIWEPNNHFGDLLPQSKRAYNVSRFLDFFFTQFKLIISRYSLVNISICSTFFPFFYSSYTSILNDLTVKARAKEMATMVIIFS